MLKRLSILIACLLLVGFPASGQGASGELLARVNNLRTSVGLTAYTPHHALNTAAQLHARWMVNTGKVSHTQDDGSGPRVRASNAGYSSNWVSENIYMGSSSGIGTAWNFWVNSPVHYAGMTSPNYNNIGIGTASGANGHAFVLVFGNSAGYLPQSINTNGSGQSANSVNAPPSFVVGIDAIGNIMHEVQPGDTLGDIALIYGYTWEDVPYMLSINGMTEDDLPYLEIGSVLLVPPQDGTYTPTPAPPSHTPTITPTSTLPSRTATEAMLVAQMVPPATFVLPSETPTPAVIVRAIPTPSATPTPVPIETSSPTSQDNNDLQTLLIIAVMIQVGIISMATIEFVRRSR